VIAHPLDPWWIDATAMGVSAGRLDALPWDVAFAEAKALEAGDIVNADEDRQVGHFWLRNPQTAPTMGQARAIGETQEAIRTFARGVRTGQLAAEDGLPFTDVIHIGIGGSALGPLLLVDALGPGEASERRRLTLHFVDNTDPDGIARLLEQVGERLRHSLVVVVSKSGGTVETRNGMALVREAVTAAGLDWRSRAVAITCEGSKLDQLAADEGWRAVFPIWDWVGGRFSITSAVGLLPAELAGIDTEPLLEGAREMDEWTRTPSWRDNPAALLAGCIYRVGEGRGDRAMVVLPYRDRLQLMARYLQQLVMESLGKRLDRAGNTVHQGLVVYGNKGSTDQHAYVQQLRDGRDDFFAVFVQALDDGAGSSLQVAPDVTAGDTLQGFFLGTRRALSSEGRPNLTITLPRVDAWHVGGLLALFERTVGLYASLIDVNAYHQPGVEAGKKAASEILDQSRRLRGALDAKKGRSVPELARALEADPLEVWSLVEKLVATGRAVRDGPVGEGRYRKA
jgi:glucose-6-phosphate isomerase